MPTASAYDSRNDSNKLCKALVIVTLVVFAIVSLLFPSTHRDLAQMKESLFVRKTPLNDACKNLGFTSPTNMKKKYRLILRGSHRHTFRFPYPMGDRYLCVPAKNGNKNWGGLFYRLWFGKVVSNKNISHTAWEEISFLGSQNIHKKHLRHLWMVTRSPYVRLLSAFIEKVFCRSTCVGHDYLGGFSMFKKLGNVTFDEFVSTLYSHVLQGRNPEDVRPVARMLSLCDLDHHLCPQSACLLRDTTEPVRILKLEEQGSWFKQFTECFEIPLSVLQGEQWQVHNHQNCFYTPTGDCKDALVVDRTASLEVDGVHGKGAAGRLGAYYNAHTAQLVTYLYEYDFRKLNHSRFDGTLASLM